MHTHTPITASLCGQFGGIGWAQVSSIPAAGPGLWLYPRMPLCLSLGLSTNSCFARFTNIASILYSFGPCSTCFLFLLFVPLHFHYPVTQALKLVDFQHLSMSPFSYTASLSALFTELENISISF